MIERNELQLGKRKEKFTQICINGPNDLWRIGGVCISKKDSKLNISANLIETKLINETNLGERRCQHIFFKWNWMKLSDSQTNGAKYKQCKIERRRKSHSNTSKRNGQHEKE